MAAKKRTSLDALIAPTTSEAPRREAKTSKTSPARKTETKKPAPVVKAAVPDKAVGKEKGEVVKSSMYIPEAVYDQLRTLAFEERKKVHDYIMEGIDRVFTDRGLKSIEELTENT